MARKNPKGTTSSVLFDVFYEDGSRNSNSKVPAELLAGLDGDALARTFFEAQESKIIALSGRPRPKIKSIVRSAKKKR
jgi:hypothetical protein